MRGAEASALADGRQGVHAAEASNAGASDADAVTTQAEPVRTGWAKD
jgi:hypothetical protein